MLSDLVFFNTAIIFEPKKQNSAQTDFNLSCQKFLRFTFAHARSSAPADESVEVGPALQEGLVLAAEKRAFCSGL